MYISKCISQTEKHKQDQDVGIEKEGMKGKKKKQDRKKIKNVKG